MKKILTVGSINMDIVNYVPEFPKPGETILGLETAYHPGGKGANQAAAAARSGARVAMAGAVGDDLYGQALTASLQRHGIDTSQISLKEGNSGLAFITVSGKGENQIVLSPGANGKLRPEDISEAIIREADLILLQNEIPFETNVHVLQTAHRNGVPVFMNPAPALKLPAQYLPLIHTIILNETEAEVMTGMTISESADAVRAAQSLLSGGVRHVLITMGRRGALHLSAESELHVPAFNVQTVDTTAAGDTFIGAFAAAALIGNALEDRLRFASAAAALAVTRKGAQESVPMYEETAAFLKST